MTILRAIIFHAIFLPASVYAAEEKTAAVPKLVDESVTGSLLQTTLGLIAVLAIIGAAAWFVKRMGFAYTGISGRLKIIGGLSVGTREKVVLLQVGEEQLLLGVAPGQIRTLHVLQEPVLPVEGETEKPESFAARLQSVLKGEAVK